MAALLRMPEVAASAVEAVLAGWPVAEGTSFATGDVIATIETEKAVVDVLAESDGVMLRALVPPGSEVSVGAPIAVLGAAGEVVADLEVLLMDLGVPTEAEPSRVLPARAASRQPSAPSTPVSSAVQTAATERVFSSPLARRLAKEHGLSLEQLIGSGRGGRIVRRDIELAVTQAPGAISGPPADATPGVAVTSPRHRNTDYIDVPHTRMRRAIAARLTASVRDAPHFSIDGTARVDRLLKLRSRLNATGLMRVSVNDFVVLAAARAHVAVPAMNVIWTDDAVRSFEHVDIALAVSSERGLLTPVLRQVDEMGLAQVADKAADLASRARAGALRQEELEGGALSVTNLGMFGTERFTAIINPPQSAILAVGAARQEPHVHRGKLIVATRMHLTLSVDHRPIDGALAAQWMKVLMELLEEPVRLLV
jgi:pyruvate dehydrogenase E2 component (dihydrolipoamide acetyltransferase)